MTTVGVKALKDHLSEYLRRAHTGERILVTEHGKPIAALAPADEPPGASRAWALVREGLATWDGGKPRGSRRAPQLRGKSAAQIVLEDRR